MIFRMSEKNKVFFKLSEYLNCNLSNLDNVSLNLYLSSDIIDFDKFKSRLLKEISDIDCTPTKEGATVEEIQDFFKEIENVPHKLQKQKKHRDLPRLNSTVIQRKEISKDYSINLCAPNPNQTVPVLISNFENITPTAECDLTPREIFDNYSACKVEIEEIISNFDKKNKNLQEYNKNLENLKKFLQQVETIANKEYKSNENLLNEEGEKDLDDLVNAIEQCLYINQNQNLPADLDDQDSLDKLNILIDIANDLLKSIT